MRFNKSAARYFDELMYEGLVALFLLCLFSGRSMQTGFSLECTHISRCIANIYCSEKVPAQMSCESMSWKHGRALIRLINYIIRNGNWEPCQNWFLGSFHPLIRQYALLIALYDTPHTVLYVWCSISTFTPAVNFWNAHITLPCDVSYTVRVR